MKVIKKGRRPSRWKGSCAKCGAVVIAEEHEMKHVTEDPREGGRFSWEVCPDCGAGGNATGYGGVCFYEVKQ